MEEDSAVSATFQSLVDRSIAAWPSVHYAGRMDSAIAINEQATILRSLRSLEELLENRQFWFFQTKRAFIRQTRFTKWDPNRLDQYILLPVDKGFVSNQDCWFFSHYWRTPEHPDPQGEDFRLCRQDLITEAWSYIWVDWTCIPQVPRTEVQERYFKRVLECIPLIITNCGFHWRYPRFEPRAWILLEVADNMLNHTVFAAEDDIKPFQSHVFEMLREGVRPVIERHGYKCTEEGDLPFIIGWLERLVILKKVVDDIHILRKREILDWVSRPHIRKISYQQLGVEIDKVECVISANGNTYEFPLIPCEDTP